MSAIFSEDRIYRYSLYRESIRPMTTSTGARGTSKCWNSPDGKHKWRDIMFVTGYAANGSEIQWPHVKCEHCGTTSWKTWDGQIMIEKAEAGK